MRKALYAGSFDPVTYGHIDVIKRASLLFDEVNIGVATNSRKKHLFSVEERKAFLLQVVSSENLRNVRIDAFNDLTVQYARKNGISILIRGLRAISDFDAEFQMALTNRNLCPEIETVFLMSSQEHFYLSSHLTKEIISLGGNSEQFVPPHVGKELIKKLRSQDGI